MDAVKYFEARGELIARVLCDESGTDHRRRTRLRLAVTAVVMAVPVALICWASKALIDPGYFTRFSTLMVVLSIASFVLIAFLETTDTLLRRLVVTSRHRVIERTLSQLLKIDASLAHRALTR